MELAAHANTNNLSNAVFDLIEYADTERYAAYVAHRRTRRMPAQRSI